MIAGITHDEYFAKASAMMAFAADHGMAFRFRSNIDEWRARPPVSPYSTEYPDYRKRHKPPALAVELFHVEHRGHWLLLGIEQKGAGGSYDDEEDERLRAAIAQEQPNA